MSLILFVGVNFSQAQDREALLIPGNSFYEFNLDASDTINANHTSYELQVKAGQNYPTTQDLRIVIDSVDAPNVDVALIASKFGDTYEGVGDTVTWAGTTGDTTIVISNTTENRYRFYRAKFTRNSGDALITEAEFKLYYE